MLKSAIINVYSEISDRTFHLKLILFFLSVIIIAVMELAGIGILVPFAAGIINGQDQIDVMQFELPINIELVGLIALFWLIKAVCIIFANFYVAMFIQDCKSRLQSSLLYQFLIKTNRNIGSDTGELFTRITNDIQMITGQILTPTSVAISELILIVVLVMIIFQVYPVGLIILIVCVLLAFVVNQLTIAKISHRIGEQRKILENKWAIKLTSALFSRFEAVTYNVEKMLHANITEFIKKSNNESGKFYALHPITRSLLEIGAIVGIVLALVIGTERGLTPGELMLFLVGSLRMLPGAIKIGYAISSIKFASSVLMQVGDILTTRETNTGEELILSDTKILLKNLLNTNVDGVVINTPGNGLNVVSGPSGVGKSTWLTSVALQLSRRNCRVGLVMQDSAIISTDLIANIRFFRENIKDERIYEILSSLRIDSTKIAKIDDLQNLSGGEKRRLMLARATADKPNFLLLDEPTAGLDAHTQREVMKYIKEISLTCNVIMISHSKTDSDFADALYKMEARHNA